MAENEGSQDSASRIGASHKLAIVFDAYLFALIALVLFIQGALTLIDLPGLYLDAINPDYLVLRLFADPKNTPYWGLPGNLAFNALPVLIQVYHGALPFYFGLPVYLLFGTGLVGVRVANLVFGLGVLSALAFAMRAMNMTRWVCGLALAGLALDPGYLFAFRTQFYITTLPLALVFVSVALVSKGRPPRRLPLAGTLAGLSVYGYFCYAFLLPALAWQVWRGAPGGERNRRIWGWALGVALGVAPFALGLLLVLIDQGGLHGFVVFFSQYFSEISVVRGMSLAERAQYAADMIASTTRAAGPTEMMTGKDIVASAPQMKTALLLGGPAIAFLLSLRPSARWQGAQTAAIGILGIFGLFVLFGDRAWLHHAAPALPLFYLGLAAFGDQAAGHAPRRWVAAAVALPLVALIVVNAVDRQRVELALERTGGDRYFSDALTHFEQDVAHAPRRFRAFLPDWGLAFPLAMMTGGTAPITTDFQPDLARKELCRGRDAWLAVMADKPPERLAAWIRETDWAAPETTVYHQRSGAPVVIAVLWKADEKPANPCK